MQCGDLAQCDHAALLFFPFHFESFHIEYLAALALLQFAVALGGRWGIVPDRAASGAITEQAPDCSLLPSSSLSHLFPHLPFIACGPADTQKHTYVRSLTQTVFSLVVFDLPPSILNPLYIKNALRLKILIHINLELTLCCLSGQ